MIIIGVVGQIAAGKGVLVDYLKEKYHFVSFSLSTIVHEELKKRKISEFTRETMQEVGNSLRSEYGDDILARRAMGKISNFKFQISNYYVIDGIRNPGEIEFLKKNPGFILIGVKAKRELRFKRLLSRAKPWDAKNWKDFLKDDRQDLGVGQVKSGQQVGKCLSYCDYVLTNNKDTVDFHRKVKELMKKVFK